jgi:hypothetical protein
MHVLLVGAELEENLALRYLASALKGAGHTFELAAFDHPRQAADVVAAALARHPAVVGLAATFQYRAREFGALAQALRDAGYRGHITAGGHFPTFAFRALLEAYPAIDSVAWGPLNPVRERGWGSGLRAASAAGARGWRLRAGPRAPIRGPRAPIRDRARSREPLCASPGPRASIRDRARSREPLCASPGPRAPIRDRARSREPPYASPDPRAAHASTRCHDASGGPPGPPRPLPRATL